MSVQARPEPAPSMATFSFEGLEGLLSTFVRGSHLEFQDDMSSLSVRDPVSYYVGNQDGKLLIALDSLERRKVAIPKEIMKLREKIFGARDSLESTDGIHSSSTVSVQESSQVPIRHLSFSSCKIDETGLEAIASLVRGHATLSKLSLKVNNIRPSLPHTMSHLAEAVCYSNLRVLELNNNPIGSRSMIQFIRNLDSPCLTNLSLAMTMQKDQLVDDQKSNPLWTEGDQTWRDEEASTVWKQEMSLVGDCLIEFISGNKRGSSQVPRLEKLALNGNDFGWKTVKKIVKSCLNGNKTLTHVELFATMKPDDSDDEEDENENGDHQSSSHSLRRSSSIGTIYLRNRKSIQESSLHGQGFATPSRSGQSSKIMMSSKSEAITKENWRFRLGRHLWKNRINRMAVKDSSRYMLRSVRALTCKCRQSISPLPDNLSPFPFINLPPEIRARIITLLDERGVLSLQQTERIISFASNPATLGYGCKSANLGLSDLALQQVQQEAIGSSDATVQDAQDYGLLPHHKWSWTELVRDFGMPRDWPATVLDENTRRCLADDDEDHRDIQGLGGGGPDGRGGITLEKSTPDSSRRKWLEEQSGLQAFWESTGTYREY